MSLGIPVSVFVDITCALERGGIRHLEIDTFNNLIAALGPCFAEGYAGGLNGWPLTVESDEDGDGIIPVTPPT